MNCRLLATTGSKGRVSGVAGAPPGATSECWMNGPKRLESASTKLPGRDPDVLAEDDVAVAGTGGHVGEGLDAVRVGDHVVAVERHAGGHADAGEDHLLPGGRGAGSEGRLEREHQDGALAVLRGGERVGDAAEVEQLVGEVPGEGEGAGDLEEAGGVLEPLRVVGAADGGKAQVEDHAVQVLVPGGEPVARRGGDVRRSHPVQVGGSGARQGEHRGDCGDLGELPHVGLLIARRIAVLVGSRHLTWVKPCHVNKGVGRR